MVGEVEKSLPNGPWIRPEIHPFRGTISEVTSALELGERIVTEPPRPSIQIARYLASPLCDRMQLPWDENTEGYVGSDALVYEIGEKVRVDEASAQRKLEEILARTNIPRGLAVDLCCGTGISTREIAKNKSLRRIVGVDIEESFVEFNAAYLKHDPRVEVRAEDALEFLKNYEGRVDLAVLAWAYHHFEDERKVESMRLLRDSLKKNGKAIVLEMFLPPFHDAASREEGVDRLYEKARALAHDACLRELDGRPATNLGPGARRKMRSFIDGIIDWTKKYENEQKFEFKVPRETFGEHIDEVGLEIEEEHKVWPSDDSLGSGGNYVFVLKKSS